MSNKVLLTERFNFYVYTVYIIHTEYITQYIYTVYNLTSCVYISQYINYKLIKITISKNGYQI